MYCTVGFVGLYIFVFGEVDISTSNAFISSFILPHVWIKAEPICPSLI
jgi:hypothetical protein